MTRIHTFDRSNTNSNCRNLYGNNIKTEENVIKKGVTKPK